MTAKVAPYSPEINSIGIMAQVALGFLTIAPRSEDF
jgi:hypothetical protein